MIRIGIGYDSHRFAEGRPFILGGQRIAFEKKLEGHSDADAVARAVTDAVLRAAGAGISTMFPDSDPKWKDADSLVMLRLARSESTSWGFIVRRPTSPSSAAATRRMQRTRWRSPSRKLGIAPDAVGIKAKTNEGWDS
jgi:2-C-methyl-D-erythritol 2,4-cyclodiphosphate synthase